MAISIEQLAEHYPRLYHMAEISADETIKRHGLLSTTAILDLVSLADEERHEIEKAPRKESVNIGNDEEGHFLIRDQKPLSASKLEGCLQDSITVLEWCTLLNRKVYFWLDKSKVESLLGARAYRDRSHMILEIDTFELTRAYEENVTLAPMNTGSTTPIGHPRGMNTISALSDYPYENRKARRLPIAVEFCIDYAVPDIYEYLVATYRGMAGED